MYDMVPKGLNKATLSFMTSSEENRSLKQQRLCVWLERKAEPLSSHAFYNDGERKVLRHKSLNKEHGYAELLRQE